MLMRIQKFLAHQGQASRRSIEKMISSGRVSVNGQVILKQGVKIDPEKDKVKIDHKLIKAQDQLVYYWLNKPVGIISAASSKYDEPTVVDLVKSEKRVYPVGRLDKDSQGLILLTNDGELTHRLTHPKYHIDKTYRVRVVGNITQNKLELLRSGIELEEGVTKPAKVTEVEDQCLEFTIHEGKHRQIRRMCAKVNFHVTELVRTDFGPIKLGHLQLGNFRSASNEEILTLKQLTKLI